MRLVLSIAFCICAQTASAETLVATRAMRPGHIVSDADVHLRPGNTDGHTASYSQAIGKEVLLSLYANQAIPLSHLGVPHMVRRNDVVKIVFSSGGLKIETEGRALGQGPLGETIRVMNLSSRAIVLGRVTSANQVQVD